MIKKTLYFGNPAYLSLRQNQLVIKMPEVVKSNLPERMKQEAEVTRPIEDIGVVVLDNKQITLTQALLGALLENNCAVITCNSACMPSGLFLPLACNTTQSERFQCQIAASLPLKKQLWQQTVKAKIANQEATLRALTSVQTGCMQRWANDVRSGDPDNLEGRAAAYYWKSLFSELKGGDGFTRGREEQSPNNLLNYGYAILRAVVARSLIASGLLPTLGIHHHNRYNAYCLADDIMEPYRPYVDTLVFGLIDREPDISALQLDKAFKTELLTVPTLDVKIGGKRSPLMVAMGQTTASLFKCFSGEARRISYPEM